METVVAVEDAEIVIGVVKDLFELRVREQRAHRAEVLGGDGNGIDERGLCWARDLEQVDAIAVAMEARRLGIDADARLALHGGDELRQLPGSIDVSRRGHSCFPSASIPAAICSSALAKVL